MSVLQGENWVDRTVEEKVQTYLSLFNRSWGPLYLVSMQLYQLACDMHLYVALIDNTLEGSCLVVWCTPTKSVRRHLLHNLYCIHINIYICIHNVVINVYSHICVATLRNSHLNLYTFYIVAGGYSSRCVRIYMHMHVFWYTVHCANCTGCFHSNNVYISTLSYSTLYCDGLCMLLISLGYI